MIVVVAISTLRGRPSCARKPQAVSQKLNYRLRPIAFFLVIAALAACAGSAGAGCDEDCKNEYVSALSECRTEYGHGDVDWQDLEDCLMDIRGEYDDCVDDCTSLGAGGVVACNSTHRPAH